MKFICIEHSAIQTIIQDRNLQSTEFESGNALCEIVSGQINVSQSTNFAKISFVNHKDGLYCIGPKPLPQKALIFDLSACQPFVLAKSNNLIVLQKVLRTAVKVWDSLSFSPSEHFVTGTKIVVFPFNIGSASQIRVTLERVNQNIGEHIDHILVYKCSTNEGGGATEQPLLGIFNLAYTGLEDAISMATLRIEIKKPTEANTSVGVIELSESPPLNIPMSMPFDSWSYFLTETQKQFVYSLLSGPSRLAGPAGTGKTLCLLLRCIYNLKHAQEVHKDCNAIFITHSVATRKAIAEKLKVLDPDLFIEKDRSYNQQSLTITTLHEWCASKVSQGIQDLEFLDRDALESKELQLLYVNEAFAEVKKKSFESYKPHLSPDFVSFIDLEEEWVVCEMLQHEIAVIIKGRASENFEIYKSIPYLKYNLPIKTESDKGFVFSIYNEYQRRLTSIGQFDTDDITLTTLAQLDTPIWRRRRSIEGYDIIFMDETHLFNINELSIAHFLTKNPSLPPAIAYSIDKAQAVGDRGSHGNCLDRGLIPESFEGQIEFETMRSVFRSSPQIVNLAFAVTSAAANLFTNFENPLEMVDFTFTVEDEKKSKIPIYYEFNNDTEIVEATVRIAEEMADDLHTKKSNIAIVAFSHQLLKDIAIFFKSKNKPFEIIKQRGDLETVNRAATNGRFVLTEPDYVGGLEFEGVVLVGVDKGRVPPSSDLKTSDSRHFLRYLFHNHLYVAITRAKYQISIVGSSERGISEAIEPALFNKLIIKDDANQ
jgi:hypothetical protein